MSLEDCWDEEGLCTFCEEPRTPEGHDPCLGTLPGVAFACCGHGKQQGYVAFKNGRCIYFDMNSVGQSHENGGEPVECGPAKIIVHGDGTVEALTPYYTELVNMKYGEPEQFT